MRSNEAIACLLRFSARGSESGRPTGIECSGPRPSVFGGYFATWRIITFAEYLFARSTAMNPPFSARLEPSIVMRTQTKFRRIRISLHLIRVLISRDINFQVNTMLGGDHEKFTFADQASSIKESLIRSGLD